MAPKEGTSRKVLSREMTEAGLGGFGVYRTDSVHSRGIKLSDDASLYDLQVMCRLGFKDPSFKKLLIVNNHLNNSFLICLLQTLTL